jgi:hypothetical protein
LQIKQIEMGEYDNRMYVIHYKDGVAFPELPGYVHVWAGKPKHTSKASQLIGDNTGANISDKNKYYSELSAIYWIWKNQSSPIVGLCHYRRFYTLCNEPFLYRFKRLLYYPVGLWKKRFGLIYTANIDYWGQRIITLSETESILNNGFDAIMPLKRRLKYSVEEHFSRYHQPDDLLMVEQVIENLHPEYLSAFQNVLKGKRIYANNMFVLKKADFDRLCEWLFEILFEFESKTEMARYTGYQERIFGFLSERLITTWIIHNQLKIKEIPLVYFKYFKHR